MSASTHESQNNIPHVLLSGRQSVEALQRYGARPGRGETFFDSTQRKSQL